LQTQCLSRGNRQCDTTNSKEGAHALPSRKHIDHFPHQLRHLFAQDTSNVKSADKSEFVVVGQHQGDKPEDFRFRMGEGLQIKATGDLVKKIDTEWTRTETITLYFDGENIAD